MLPYKSGKLTISKSNASLLSEIEQTKSSFDMSISKSKYSTTFLYSDVSETTSSSEKISLRNCLNLGLLILIFEELFKPWVIDIDEVVNIA